jgi:hypothetical protein
VGLVRDILIFTPVLRLEPATVGALMALEWGGPLTLVLQRDNPATGDDARAVGIVNHLHQYQRGRDLFLGGGYDALLVVESDIIPPPDALRRLAALAEQGAEVSYGAYLFRGNGRPMVNVLERYGGWPAQARNVGEPLNGRGLWRAAVRQGVIDCSGSGLGCTLIRRHVLEAVPFTAPEGPGHFDTYWTNAVYQAGYRMMADLAVQCGHVDPDRGVLWPSS